MPASNRTALVTLVTLLSAAPAPAGGLERTWIDPLGGPFDTAVSWSPVGVPGPLDTATFNLNLTYGISFAQFVANELMNISEGDVTFDLSSMTYTLRGAVVGDNPLDVATLTLVNGTLAVEFLGDPGLQVRIGKDAGAVGT